MEKIRKSGSVMKKILSSISSLFLLGAVLFAGGGSPGVVNAEESPVPIKDIEFLTGNSMEGYNYIEYSDPVTENYDGKSEVLLGNYEPIEKPGKSKAMDFREYDVWYVYDQGITQSWSWLSNPYFIKSIARGMEYEETVEVSATISASYGGNIPNESKSSVNSSFGLNASGSMKVTARIKLSGPDAGYTSRDFYYKHGRNTHSVKIVQEHRSNWDGKLWTKEYFSSVGVPAIKHYSLDRK
ncbi:hypothetical protein [Brevibacillus formosus]|uniref:hypothetical protein n=1 Tax=Brevibacillus formosus TaxID=54913 RepID=UPI003F1D4DD7